MATASDHPSFPGFSSFFPFDPDFEFSAPHFYDFACPETAAQVADAERWFKTSGSHAASPFSIRSRELNLTPITCSHDDEYKVEQMDTSNSPYEGALVHGTDSSSLALEPTGINNHWSDTADIRLVDTGAGLVDVDLRTPAKQCRHQAQGATGKKSAVFSPGSLPAKRIYAEMSKKMPHTDKPVTKTSKSSFLRRTQNVSFKNDKTVAEKSSAQEVQATKKQKLENGRLRKIMDAKDLKQLPRTPAPLTVPHAFQFCTEKRVAAHKGTECSSVPKMGKPASPFVSMAEKVQRFQMRTPDRFHMHPLLSHDDAAVLLQEKPKLKLTRPKEPALETSQRVRHVKVKSTAELEAEILAKIPKFKARPLNKKILEAPTLPLPQKSTPPVPEFHEFHLRTMERASQQCATTSVSSTSSATFEEIRQRRKSIPSGGLIEPRQPHLETALRARPMKIKSSEEREQDELASIPKFKARPVDKKIFWSRGDLGVFRTNKREVTTPVEFHFATDERIHGQPELPLDLFSKLSLNSQQENQPPQLTKVVPFHLTTQERGQQKEQRFLMEIRDNGQREQEARIPKANPLPYTTDYPDVPLRPAPKQCTIPEPFQLESVRRHQEDLQRMEQEQKRLDEEEAVQRKFHAQPIGCIGPVFVPERSRKPLTEVHEFDFHVDTRAVERTEFDRKVMEKQNLYKRFREEYEAARKADEERIIKAMRRTMVPHARPMPAFQKPFIPKRSSKGLTRPHSPRLNVTNRRERRNSLTFRRQSMTFSIQKRLQMR